MPLVSVIIPIYNVEAYLDRCVNSVVNQTLKDLEIILVDDESPDQCPTMCDEWATKDSRIRVVHKKNGGLGYARNTGLDVATGQYVTFLDSDDFVELETYERVYSEAQKRNLDICYFKHQRVTADGRTIKPSTDNQLFYFEGREQVDSFMLNMIGPNPDTPLQDHFSMSVCMGIFRLSLIQDSGIRFVSERDVASEDLIFHLHYLPKVERIGVLPFVYYNYFINPASITTTYSEGKYKRMIRLLMVVKEELLKRFLWDQVRNHYFSQQMRIIKIVLRYESSSASFSLTEKCRRVKRCCREKLFDELYSATVVKKYSAIDKGIIWLMRHRMALPLVLMYMQHNEQN